jgi:hypothetical protein
MSDAEIVVRALDGAWSRSEVEDLVAAMLLFTPQTAEPDDATLELLGRLGGRAGVVEADDAQTTAAKVAAYLGAHPPPPALVDAVVQALTGLVQKGAIDRGSAFGRYADDGAGLRPVGGPAPAGSVQGGLRALLQNRSAKP